MNKTSYTLSTLETKLRVLKLSGVLIMLIVSGCAHKSVNQTRPFPQADLICNTPQLYANKVVGDGHCVSLIKKCADAPLTSQWRAGKRVLGYADQLPLGTIIATFKNGRYPNTEGFHAAIYISHDRDGIWVWDQWRGKPVHRRLIRSRNDGANASNSAQAYSVVKLDK